MATLFIIKGADEGKRFEMNAPVVGVGRDPANIVRLHDTEVSRRHAEFRLVNGDYKLIDLASSNGTYLNNHSIKEAPLHSGDHIQIGQTVLVYAASPAEGEGSGDLADRIRMISRTDLEVPASIVKAISEKEGKRLLAEPHEAGGPWLQKALASLRAMYETAQAISHILDIDQLLEKIMDLIFQSIEADRGCIMLRNSQTKLFEPKAARWRSGIDRQEKITISRTIMEHVLKEGQGVLVADAAQDERFSPAQSIVRFGIREAICVPMKGRHETLGVIYLDTRMTAQQLIAEEPTSKLTEDHLRLAIAIAHQAALALEETRYYHAMVQHERLAAVGQTIAAISHHVKNILQGLRSGSDLLRMGMQDKNDNLMQQGWKIVEKNQSRIYDLVMDMLSYSKDREPALESTDINAVVQDVLELVQSRIETANVQLDLRLHAHLPTILADPEGLHRALLNIVGNALDALDGQERPVLSILSAPESSDRWIRIVVADNGSGITPEMQSEIFKPFVSTKGSRGTGLGLAVSRKILREHGGDILLQSQPGQGSRFILRLPVHTGTHAEGATIAEMTLETGDEPVE